jgi:uncharacterized protein YjdB
MLTQTKTSMRADQLMERAFLKTRKTGKILGLLLLFFCLPIGVWAQKTINLNSGSIDFQMSPLSNIPSEYLKEAKAARFFSINPALQQAASVEIGDIVNLQLFEGDNYTATVSSIVTDVNGNFTLTLKLPDYPMGFAIITTSIDGKSLVNVSIPERSRSFGSRYSGNSNVNYLIEIDESKIERPHCGTNEITMPQEIEIFLNENGDNVKNLAPRQKSVQASNCGPDYNTNTSSPATISVLVVYTPAAAQTSYASSHGGMSNLIATMIALGNTCLSNSQTGITLVLAHSAQVNYTENNVMTTSLNRLQNPSDGYMDNVHALRKQYNADLVQLLTTDNDSGGYGNLLTNTSGSTNSAFSVCWVTQVADNYPCSVHELGHNMGLGHGAQQTSAWSNGIFDYSYGYRLTGTTNNAYGNKYYTTVMSYAGNYYGDGLTPQYISYFSNPNINYQSAATGTTSQIGPNNKSADAARSLREMKHVVAYYSDRVQNLPDAPTNIVVSNPTNNGATFTWDACANATGYRVCHPIGGGYYYSYYTTTNTTYPVSNSDWFPSQCTNYEFFIMAVNECGDAVSSPTLTFKTKCVTDPTVTTSVATNIAINSATLNKTVTENGTAVTEQGFEYRETSSSTWQTTTSNNVTGLTAGTQYKFYAYATTANGTINGTVLSFTTTSVVSVTGVTVSPTNVSFTSIEATQQLTATVAPANATNQTVTWSSSDTSVATVATDGLVTAVGCGTATITATTQDGNETATCTVTVTIPNGIETIEVQAALHIYPNPVKDELYILSQSSIDKIEIWDISGRIIIDNVQLTNDNAINLSGLSSGAYFARIFTENQIITKKIIKQ